VWNNTNIPYKLAEEVPWCLWCTDYYFGTATHWKKRRIKYCNMKHCRKILYSEVKKIIRGLIYPIGRKITYIFLLI
jgi:hypothetical protein